MGKSRDFTSHVKQMIVDKYLSSQKYADIARDLTLPRNSVYAVVQRFFTRGSVKKSPRSGRKRKIDDRGTRKLLKVVQKKCTLPLSDITALYNQCIPLFLNEL